MTILKLLTAKQLKPKAKIVAFISLFLSISLLGTFSANAAFQCSDFFYRNEASIFQEWQKFRENFESEYEAKYGSREHPKEIQLNQRNYKVEKFLRQDVEGYLYLVKIDNGYGIIKVLQLYGYDRNPVRDREILNDHIQWFNKEIEKDVEHSKILAVDSERNLILLSYFEGILVSDIRSFHLEFGMSSEQAKAILQNFSRSPYAGYMQANVVYSLKLEKFFLVSPRN